MSLQSIMDATPIEWRRTSLGDYIGSGNRYNYIFGESGKGYIFHWYTLLWEEWETLIAKDPQEIIDKINELEGIK